MNQIKSLKSPYETFAKFFDNRRDQDCVSS